MTESTAPAPPYLRSDLPVETRVDDLLQRMTLEEKAAQMQCVWREKDRTLVDAQGAFGELEDLVRPMLAWKFRLGLFEEPYVDPDGAEALAECPAHRDLALLAARETITLLKNENDLAPLDPAAVRSVAVIGPNADRVLLGGYSGRPTRVSTVLEGIRARVGDNAKVLYHKGCRITVGGSWEQDEVVVSDPEEDRRMIAEAVEVARGADVVILAVGGNEQTSREAYAANHMGDRASLDLVGLQDELAEALVATGRPVIALLFNVRPLAVHRLAEMVPVLFECWYLGQETGPAVAEVLFGDVNPGGKLPITVPRSVGHVPAFYNHKPAARRGYLFDEVTPLFAFGFGLSYTRFEISAPRLGAEAIRPDESTVVEVDVTNRGERAGDEVVQLYIRDCISSVTRPVKELKGFARVRLGPGETRTVSLPITPDHLSFYTLDMDYAVEPGDFEVMVGTSSRDEDLHIVPLKVIT